MKPSRCVVIASRNRCRSYRSSVPAIASEIDVRSCCSALKHITMCYMFVMGFKGQDNRRALRSTASLVVLENITTLSTKPLKTLLRNLEPYNFTELQGTPKNSEELQGTPRNSREIPGVPKNVRKPKETPGTCISWERQGTLVNSKQLHGTPGNAIELHFQEN